MPPRLAAEGELSSGMVSRVRIRSRTLSGALDRSAQGGQRFGLAQLAAFDVVSVVRDLSHTSQIVCRSSACMGAPRILTVRRRVAWVVLGRVTTGMCSIGVAICYLAR